MPLGLAIELSPPPMGEAPRRRQEEVGWGRCQQRLLAFLIAPIPSFPRRGKEMESVEAVGKPFP